MGIAAEPEPAQDLNKPPQKKGMELLSITAEMTQQATFPRLLCQPMGGPGERLENVGVGGHFFS